MATEQEILSFRNTVEDIRREIGKEIIGQQDVVEHMIMALVAGGNVLLEGVPGLGKTRLVRTLSHVLDLPFSRIQFTPDLMPADITGPNIIVKTPLSSSPARCLPRSCWRTRSTALRPKRSLPCWKPCRSTASP